MKLLPTLLLLILAIYAALVVVNAQQQDQQQQLEGIVHISDNAGKRMQKVNNIILAGETLTATTTISPSFSLANSSTSGRFYTSRNPIIGFGGSFMRAGAMMLNSLSQPKQDAVLRDLFDPIVGAGFRVGKVPVAATDFQSPIWYSYEDIRGSFSIDYDLHNVNGTIPYIKKAVAAAGGRNFTLESTMDYPPQWMLNTSTPLPKAQVNTTLYAELAQYYIDFFTAFGEAGVEIDFLDMWNEPFESYTSVTQSQAAVMLKDHLAPRVHEMRAQGKKTPKISFGCQYGREISYEEWRVFLEDPAMINATDFYAVHGYDSYFTCGGVNGTGIDSYYNTTVPNVDKAFDDFRKYINTFRDSNPLAHTMMTEVCYATEFDNYPSNSSICPKLPRLDFMDAMQWGRMIFGDLHAGATGWIYWNLLLNTSGGPWLESPIHNDPLENPQQPVIVVDPATDSYEYTGCYWAMAHFGRFVLPGMNKIENFFRKDSLPPNVHAIAFIGDASGVNATTCDYKQPQVMNQTVKKRLVLTFMNDRLDEQHITLAVFPAAAQNNNSENSYYYSALYVLPPVSFVTMEFIIDAETQIYPVVPENTNNNNKKNDDLADGWQAPVIGTICALIFVAVVTVSFWKFVQNKDSNRRIDNAANANNEGEYKAMA